MNDDLRDAIVAAAIDWFEWEAAHAPDGGAHDPRDVRLYRLLADPEVRAAANPFDEHTRLWADDFYERAPERQWQEDDVAPSYEDDEEGS